MEPRRRGDVSRVILIGNGCQNVAGTHTHKPNRRLKMTMTDLQTARTELFRISKFYPTLAGLLQKSVKDGSHQKFGSVWAKTLADAKLAKDHFAMFVMNMHQVKLICLNHLTDCVVRLSRRCGIVVGRNRGNWNSLKNIIRQIFQR